MYNGKYPIEWLTLPYAEFATRVETSGRIVPGRGGWRACRRRAGIADVETTTVFPGDNLTALPQADPEAREARWRSLEAATALGRDAYGKPGTVDFVIEDDLPIAVAFVGDIHDGGPILYERFRADMEVIRDTDGLFAMGMGDYIDNFKPQMKNGSGLYHAVIPDPAEQIEHCADRMGIARGKWVAITGGNHDAFDGRTSGIDRLPDLAKRLGCHHFSEGGGTVNVHVGDQRYVTTIVHQFRGGGGTNTSNEQRRTQEEFPHWDTSDIICLGHRHYNDLHQPPRKDGYATWLRSGTYKVDDPYSKSQSYASEYGVPVVILFPDKKEVLAFRGNHYHYAVEMLTHLRRLYREGYLGTLADVAPADPEEPRRSRFTVIK